MSQQSTTLNFKKKILYGFMGVLMGAAFGMTRVGRGFSLSWFETKEINLRIEKLEANALKKETSEWAQYVSFPKEERPN